MSLSIHLVRAFLLAALLSSGITYLLIRWSVRLRLVAQPRADRWHGEVTPNTGGLAILFASVFCYLLFGSGQYSVIAVCAGFVSLLGFLDDRVQLRPLLKFAGQSVAAIVVIASGVVFRGTPWDWVNLVITFLWIAGITNAFNLIDNMDGLCAGVAVIICGSRIVLAIRNHDDGGALLLTVLAGSVLGFLIFNHKPARIFMGDCGSMFVGFSLGALAIASPVPNTRVFVSTIFYPALAFLYPIFDTVLVSVLRRSAGRPISVGGRDHSSHRLVSLGLTERKTVWLLWLLAAVGASAGLLSYLMPVGVLAIAILLISGVSIFGIFLATLPAYVMPDTAPVRAKWIRRVTPNLRAGVTLVVDTLLAGVALLVAFLIRWENTFIGPPMQQFLLSLPVVMGFYALASIGFRTFDSGWRWFGARDLFALGRCAVASATASIFVVWFLGMRGYSRGVVLLYAFLVLAFTAGLRLSMQFLWQSLAIPVGARRVAVLGANGAAALTVLVMQQSGLMNAEPIGIIDADPAADRRRIHGVKVHYSGSDACRLLRKLRADLLVVPSGETLTDEHRRILEQCREAGVPIEQFEVGMRSWNGESKTAKVGSQVVA
jgi:UDP-GlcNAc:undecaprenyl-phosphate/decaprenyl-phosphate GlcNAc-1-phosphate transferase